MNNFTRYSYFFLLINLAFYSCSLKPIETKTIVGTTIGLALTALAGKCLHERYQEYALHNLYLENSSYKNLIKSNATVSLLQKNHINSEQDCLKLVTDISSLHKNTFPSDLSAISSSLRKLIDIGNNLRAQLETAQKQWKNTEHSQKLHENTKEIEIELSALLSTEQHFNNSRSCLLFLHAVENITKKYNKELLSLPQTTEEIEILIRSQYALDIYPHITYMKQLHQDLASLYTFLDSFEIPTDWKTHKSAKNSILPHLEKIKNSILISPLYKQEIINSQDALLLRQHRAKLEKLTHEATQAEKERAQSTLRTMYAQEQLVVQQQKLITLKQEENKFSKMLSQEVLKQNELLKEQDIRVQSVLKEKQKLEKCMLDEINNLEKIQKGLSGTGAEGVPNIYTPENASTYLEKQISRFKKCIKN